MGKKKTKNQSTGKRNVRLEQLEEGIALCTANPLFGRMGGYIRIRDQQTLGKNNAAIVTRQGEILVNQDIFETMELCYSTLQTPFSIRAF